METENHDHIANRPPWSPVLRNWAPAVLWACVIFLFSTESFSSVNTSKFLEPLLSGMFSRITAEQFEVIHLLIRKLSHWSEYFIFSLLLIRASHGQFNLKLNLRQAVWVAAAVSIYALSDEFHQLFVSSRTASLADAALDSFGGICGILWTYLRPKGNSIAASVPPGDDNGRHFCKKT